MLTAAGMSDPDGEFAKADPEMVDLWRSVSYFISCLLPCDCILTLPIACSHERPQI